MRSATITFVSPRPSVILTVVNNIPTVSALFRLLIYAYIGTDKNVYEDNFLTFFRTYETIQCTRSSCARTAVSGIEIKFSFVTL